MFSFAYNVDNDYNIQSKKKKKQRFISFLPSNYCFMEQNMQLKSLLGPIWKCGKLQQIAATSCQTDGLD